MHGSRRRLAAHALPALALLLALSHHAWVLLAIVRTAAWLLVRAAQLVAVLAGSGSVWWLLRSYQLALEHELHADAVARYTFTQRYRPRAATIALSNTPNLSSSIFDARGQLKRVQHLPVDAHLRTAWNLPPVVSDELAHVVHLALREYVAYWFTPLAPTNDDFVRDVEQLLADLLGAIAARVLAIDSSQALALTARTVELLRLHLGWFREAFADVAESAPDAFDACRDGDATDDATQLARRQELLAAHAQSSPLLHPGCVAPSSTSRPMAETADVVYLRHVAAQVLVQLAPELGDASNSFATLVLHLLREAATFRALKPLAEYAQPRFANALVLALLQPLLTDKDKGDTINTVASTGTSTSTNTSVGGLTLERLRVTTSLLYRATKRSSEQAEAALQAVVDAVSAAAVAAPSDAPFDADDWPDSFGLGGLPSSSLFGGASASPSPSPDRVSVNVRGPRLRTPRAFLPTAAALSTGARAIAAPAGAHIDDLKAIKANIGSSLNKVKRRFRTLSGHPQDQSQQNQQPETPGGTNTTSAFVSTQAAARMMKRPGMLFQKALLRRHDGAPAASPVSPMSSLDDVLTPPPLSDAELFGINGVESPLAEPPLMLDELVGDGDGDETDDDDAVEDVAGTAKTAAVQLLAKAVAQYVRMGVERPEMRSSARARELYDLLAALEDIFLLGLNDFDTVDNVEHVDNVDHTVPGTEQLYWRYFALPRPDTPFLVTHAQFVARQCPPCVSNSSAFASVRGVQWLLVALERGALWDLVTALHLDQRSAAKCYDEHTSVVRDATHMARVLASLFELTAAATALEIPRELGRRSDMDEVFGVATAAANGQQQQRRASTDRRRSSSGCGSNSPNDAICIVERVFETERYVPLQGWTPTPNKRTSTLPSTEWVWETEWTLAPNAVLWTYARSFDDHFRAKQRKFDSVRRREWRRRRRLLPPVLTVAAGVGDRQVSQSANSSVVAIDTVHVDNTPPSPPALFGAASLPVAPVPTVVTIGTVRHIKQLFDVTTKRGSNSSSAKAKTDDSVAAASGRRSPSTPSTRRFGKRRSNSFDKAIASSLLADLVLDSPPTDAAVEASADVLTTVSAVSTSKTTRRSIPSLRRAQTSSEKDVKATLGLVRSTTTTGASSAAVSVVAAVDTRRRPLDVDALALDTTDHDVVCFCCLELPTDASSLSQCTSCQQRVCPACHAFEAFAALPPPLETSRKTRVCAACYRRFTSRYRVRIDAHVSRYFRDGATGESTGATAGTADDVGSDSEPTTPSTPTGSSRFATTATAAPALFELAVFVADEPARAWSVVKRFDDFEALEKQLVDKLRKQEKRFGSGNATAARGSHWKGVDYTELLDVAPRLRALPVAALAYSQRLVVLEAFVQSLLARDTLCQSPVVHAFLQLSNAVGSGVSMPLTVTTTESTLSDSRGPTAGASASAASGVLLMENGKWRKGRYVAPATSSNETKVRLLQRLEVALFAVVGEVFEFDGIGVVRRQLFAMSRSFIKAFLSASHFRKVEKSFLSFTDPLRVAAAVVALREYMFPDASAAAAAAAAAAPLSERELELLRKETLEAIAASFPSTLVSLFGETSCETAALKLHEFLQHEVFVKNLLFSVADELLLHVFPDFVTYKPAATTHTTTTAATTTTPVATTPATMQTMQTATTPTATPTATQTMQGVATTKSHAKQE